MWKRLLQQPTALLELVRQLVIWVMVMGWVNWTDVQQLQTIAVASAVLAVLNFLSVTPNVSVEEKAEDKAAAMARLAGRIAPLILLAVILVGCAGALKVALQAETQIHEGLRRARTTIVQVCPEKTTSEACAITRSAFNDVLDAAVAYNRGLANKDLTQGPQLVKAIQNFIAKIKAVKLPELQSTVADVTYAQGGVK